MRDRHELLESLILFFHRDNAAEIVKAQEQDERLPQQNPVAFDLSHYAYLSSAGASLGLLDADEARVFLLRGAHKAQASYRSWQDYAAGFQADYNVNLKLNPPDHPAAIRRQRKRVRRIIKTLLTRRKSPWRQFEWQTELPALTRATVSIKDLSRLPRIDA